MFTIMSLEIFTMIINTRDRFIVAYTVKKLSKAIFFLMI